MTHIRPSSKAPTRNGKKNANVQRSTSNVQHRTGRPEVYSEAILKVCVSMALLGATDKQMADAVGVSEQTFNTWKKKHPEFLESLKGAKAEADAKVEKSLFERACGFKHQATHFTSFQGEVIETPYTEVYAPDTTAAIFWLKNRQPERWRDVSKVEHSGKIAGGNSQVEEMSVEEIEAELAKRGAIAKS